MEQIKEEEAFTLDRLQMELEGEKNEFDRLVGSWKHWSEKDFWWRNDIFNAFFLYVKKKQRKKLNGGGNETTLGRKDQVMIVFFLLEQLKMVERGEQKNLKCYIKWFFI